MHFTLETMDINIFMCCDTYGCICINTLRLLITLFYADDSFCWNNGGEQAVRYKEPRLPGRPVQLPGPQPTVANAKDDCLPKAQ